jgi:hypothetical protein
MFYVTNKTIHAEKHRATDAVLRAAKSRFVMRENLLELNLYPGIESRIRMALTITTVSVLAIYFRPRTSFALYITL